MPAPPIPAEDARRAAALLRHPVWAPGPDPTLDTIVTVAATVFDVPYALVTLIDRSHQRMKAAFGWGPADTPRAHSFCGYTILADQPLLVADAATDPRTADNPFVTGPPGLRFYAGVRLVADGQAFGALCVMDIVPRSFRATDLRLLMRIGGIAAARLARM